MDIRQLKRFVTVVEAGGFNKAADLLAVSQPSLSRSIVNLEKMLGAQLFARGPRGIALSSAGEALLPHAYRILKERERAIISLDVLSGNRGELIEIGVDPSFSLHLIPALLWLTFEKKEHVEVLIREDSLGSLLDQLRGGHLRMVFGPRNPIEDTSNLCFQALSTERAGIILRASHPAMQSGPPEIADLIDAKWIVPDHPTLIQGWSDMFHQAGLPIPPIALRSSSVRLNRECLLAGDFVSLGNNSTYADYIAAGHVVCLDAGMRSYERPIGVYRVEDSRLSATEHNIISTLQKSL